MKAYSKQKISCPHCKTDIIFTKKHKREFIGSVAGGSAGYALASGLGIAGAVAGAPVAIPAAFVGAVVFGIVGNRTGKWLDDKGSKCPECKKSLVL